MSDTMFAYKYHSPLSPLVLISNANALTGLRFEIQKPESKGDSNNDTESNSVEWVDEPLQCPILAQTVKWLDRYFAGLAPDFMPPIELKGSKFEKAVWNRFLEIPYGSLSTYGTVAARVARDLDTKVSAQAVGNAAKHNPIVILIPCHRVIGANRALTGYAAGLEFKEKLLQLERSVPKSLF